MELPASLIELSKLLPTQVHQIVLSHNVKLPGSISEIIYVAKLAVDSGKISSYIEREFINSPFFEESLRNKNLEKLTMYRIFEGLKNFSENNLDIITRLNDELDNLKGHSFQNNEQLVPYRQTRQNNEQLVPYIQTRQTMQNNQSNSVCKTNVMDNGVPIDPLNMEQINEGNLVVVNDTCYEKSSIQEYLNGLPATGQVNDINNHPISTKDILELMIQMKVKNNVFENVLVDKFQLLTNESLKELKFPQSDKLILVSNKLTSIAEVDFDESTKIIVLASNNPDLIDEFLIVGENESKHPRSWVNKYGKQINLPHVDHLILISDIITSELTLTG